MKSLTSLPIVLVDEEPQTLDGMSVALRTLGYPRVIAVADARMVAPTLQMQPVGAVLLEPAMTSRDGRTMLEEISAGFPDIPVVVLTAIDDLSTAVECMRAGAVDYLVKPVEHSRLASALRRALRARRERQHAPEPDAEDERPVPAPACGGLVTQDAAMVALCRHIEKVAPSPQAVLITGESGTGKELVATALHQLSHRPGPLVTVNVAGLDDTLFADTLFGHTRGAFTGAERGREGLLEAAAGGTIFLDEIGELSAVSQVKLLRLLQDGTYYALGADRPRHSRARVVTATNRDVAAAAAAGQFRGDLFYRLRTHHLHLPPLRARLDDLPLLVDHFVDKAASALGRQRPAVPAELYTLLRTYAFPGNVRELEAMIFDAVAQADGRVLGLRVLRQAIFESACSASDSPADVLFDGRGRSRLPTLQEAETALISEALERAEGNQSIAAGLLGLSRQALNKRLSRRKAADAPPAPCDVSC